MKTTDKEKIKNALSQIVKLKWVEEKDGGNEFKKGMASISELMLTIISEHGNSSDYQYAFAELIRRSK